MNWLTFIDRDGTINVEKGYVHCAQDLEWIPGSLEALKKLNQRKILIYIITNQAGIAKGLYTKKDFLLFNRYFLNLLKKEGVFIKDVLYCPHHPEGIIKVYKKSCECRKPGNKLLLKALHQERIPSNHAVVIGDRNTDILAGQSLGMKAYLVLTGYGAQETKMTHADFIVTDLQEAVDHFLASLPAGKNNP